MGARKRGNEGRGEERESGELGNDETEKRREERRERGERVGELGNEETGKRREGKLGYLNDLEKCNDFSVIPLKMFLLFWF